MINISLNIDSSMTAQHLKELLQALEPVTPQAPIVAVNEITKSIGEPVQGRIDRTKARLAELGLTRAPRATTEEMELRALVEEQRQLQGYGKIDWLDFPAREAALAGIGYCVVKGSKSTATPNQVPQVDGGEVFTGEIPDEAPLD